MPSRSATKRNRYRRSSPQQEAASFSKQALSAPWQRQHPTLAAIQDRLQLVLDAWNLLRAPDGSCRRKPYLPQGIKEPDPVYESRIQHAQPMGFFRDALLAGASLLTAGFSFGEGGIGAELQEALGEEISVVLKPNRVLALQAGDTLQAIAERYGTTVQTLRRLNPHVLARDTVLSAEGDTLLTLAGQYGTTVGSG